MSERDLPSSLEAATAHQRRAGIALAAALRAGPAHAYLLRGPAGAGKRAAARAFAAEILAAGAADAEDTRRRALLDPSPHPDLVWLTPPGAQHLVEQVREQVIKGAAYRPLEGERRVFVIDEAEAMREESQNALLKTLEEPAPFAHFILVASEPDLLTDTVLSRCLDVPFAPLSAEAVEKELGEVQADPSAIRAAALLCGGDVGRARSLLRGPGREMRSHAERCIRAARRRELEGAPWLGMLEAAEEAGEQAAAAVERRADAELEGYPKGRELRRLRREVGESAKRLARRRRTDALELGLELCVAWLRDLALVAQGASDLALNRDRASELSEDADGLDPSAALYAISLITDTSRRLRELNVSEELALEALFFRLEDRLGL